LRVGLQGPQKPCRDGRNLVDCRLKGFLVCLGWLIEAGDFPDELQRSRAHFIVGHWRIEVKKRFDIPAHFP
jgi:hypothetical protein